MTLESKLQTFSANVGKLIFDTRKTIGTLSALTTTAKTDVVSAINEVKASVPTNAATSSEITTATAKAVKVNAAQSFTTAEKLQGRSNIDAVGTADVGNTEQDLVAVMNAAMV